MLAEQQGSTGLVTLGLWIGDSTTGADEEPWNRNPWCVWPDQDVKFQLQSTEESVIFEKVVGGKILFNNGEYAELDIFGLEGIEKNLRLETDQVSIFDTSLTEEEFLQEYAVGREFKIRSLREFVPLEQTTE